MTRRSCRIASYVKHYDGGKLAATRRLTAKPLSKDKDVSGKIDVRLGRNPGSE